MVRRIRSQDRYIPRGSMDQRLAPEIADDRLNVKLGPRVPKVRETSEESLNIGDSAARRRATGLAPKFIKD